MDTSFFEALMGGHPIADLCDIQSEACMSSFKSIVAVCRFRGEGELRMAECECELSVDLSSSNF